jgi:hypothetical protein
MRFERNRLNWLIDAMVQDVLAPLEKVHLLRTELAEFYKDDHFLKMRTMGELLKHSLESIGHLH